MSFDELFQPITVGGKKLKNRLAFAPTGMGTADDHGRVTDQTLCHYTARAKGGVGMVIVEHTMAHLKYGLEGIGSPAFHRDRNLPGMYDLANAIKSFDAVSVVQLGLGLGRQVGHGLEPFGPSPVPVEFAYGSMPKGLKHLEGITAPPPKELTIPEIEELENLFIEAAVRTKTAGFDGIEIHGAHGYALASFLSPHANQRTDRYGGSMEKRLTLALNLVGRCRESLGKDFIIGFRISGDEHIPGGRGISETRDIAKILEKESVDYIHLSSGTLEATKFAIPDKSGAILPEAAAVREVVDIPVICPNIHDPQSASTVVKEGKADIVSLSRSLLADPEWPNKVREGRIGDIRKCILCNTCFKMLYTGFQTRCAVNPDVGRERFMPEYFPPPRKIRGRHSDARGSARKK
jgi:2,4-dienoyl-CoA reductase-like NADH-dependent reductase (Old Yellow Enzyme family)